ncbi:MAG: signal recognition particle-docking protein FtsY [Myxococcota bacterium]
MDELLPFFVAAAVALVALVVFLVRRGGSDADADASARDALEEPAARAETAARAEPPAPAAEAPATDPAPAPLESIDTAPPEAVVEAPPTVAPAAGELGDAAAPAPPPTPEAKAPQPTREEDLAALRKGLAGTRSGFMASLSKIFRRSEPVDDQLLEEIEEVLITSDIGVRTADAILGALREAQTAGNLEDGEQAWAALRAHATRILDRPGGGPLSLEERPTVILVVGVNGAGKTTTIGKLASRFKAQGKEVLLAAGDTFRAAAVLQLEVWGQRTGCEVVKGKDRGDPGAVIFDAIAKGVERGVDVVIADTAGRLHTKTPLMGELEKVGRSAEKALGRPIDEILLVLDSTTGQNAIQQAELFKKALPVSGIALTKLDGTAKGGVILGIVDAHEVPVRYVGVGERVEDLRDFDAAAFVEALFAPAEEAEGPSVTGG